MQDIKIVKLRRAIVKEELVVLTGDHIGAMILNQLLYWTEITQDVIQMIDEDKQFNAQEDVIEPAALQKLRQGWISKSAHQLQEELMLVGVSRQTVSRKISRLVEMGLIERRKNPFNSLDQRWQYRVNISTIVFELAKLGYYLQGYRYIFLKQGSDIKIMGVHDEQSIVHGKRSGNAQSPHQPLLSSSPQNNKDYNNKTSNNKIISKTINKDSNKIYHNPNSNGNKNNTLLEKKNNTSISSPYGEEILSSNPNCENFSSFRAGCFFNNNPAFVNNNTPGANRFSSNKEGVFLNADDEYISRDKKNFSFRESEFSTTGGKYISGNNNNTPSAKKNSLSKEGVPPVEDTPGGEAKKTRQKDNIPYEEIINYLNEKAGKHFKANTKATRRLIHARWNEGFRLEDFKQVIDNKVADWKDNPEMSKYLRPQTLFGPKFEGYLNQASPVTKTQPAPADGVPYEEIVSLYNRILPELPPAKVLNEKRKRLIAERWQEEPERQNLFWWENFFRHVRKSGFLMGLVIRKGQKPFKADFDWLLLEDHFIHVLEGRYHGPIAGVDIGEKALLTMRAAEGLSTEVESEGSQKRLH